MLYLQAVKQCETVLLAFFLKIAFKKILLKIKDLTKCSSTFQLFLNSLHIYLDGNNIVIYDILNHIFIQYKKTLISDKYKNGVKNTYNK
jgi:hypothetical protein